MSRRSLDNYVRAFEEKGGLGAMSFFGEDVNGFTREELLALVGWLSDELSRAQERNTKYSRGLLGL